LRKDTPKKRESLMQAFRGTSVNVSVRGEIAARQKAENVEP